MASPAKKGPHQRQPSNTASVVPTSDHVAYPSTPARPTSASLRRSARGSEKTIEVLTLPGTRWDRLDIERQRESSRQAPITASSPAERRRENWSLLAKQRGISGRRGQFVRSSSGPSALSPSVNPTHLAREFSPQSRPIMARRPGRNQVDYVAELKETIHESLSKLSEIHEKLAPLGQQIVALEEELKAKESDGSKLQQISVFLNLQPRPLC